jgi:hypothetical protein
MSALALAREKQTKKKKEDYSFCRFRLDDATQLAV